MKTWRVLLALVAGLAAGAVLAAQGGAWVAIVPFTDAVGTIWINAIRMTVVPLIVAITVTGIASSGEGIRIARLSLTTLVTLVALLLAAGFFAVLVAPAWLGTLSISPDAAASLRSGLTSSASSDVVQLPSLAQRIVDFVPANVVKAAADGAILPLVVFAMLLGFAIKKLDAPARRTLTEWFRAIADAMMIIVGWVLAVAAVGVFALGVGFGARLGLGAASAMLRYVAVMCAVCFAFVLLLYPVAILVGRVPARLFFSAAAPAQAVALSTRSSFAALPAMITAFRDRLGFPPSATGFVLPLVVSVSRLNVPITWVVGVLFLSQLYGVPVTEGRLAELVFVATMLSFSVPGIPSGSLFLLAPVLTTFGIPAEGIGILIAVDTVPDMFKTLLSVQGHLTAVSVVNALGGDRGLQNPQEGQ
jgi:Na+/H+-dicarboxylate symporter